MCSMDIAAAVCGLLEAIPTGHARLTVDRKRKLVDIPEELKRKASELRLQEGSLKGPSSLVSKGTPERWYSPYLT